MHASGIPRIRWRSRRVQCVIAKVSLRGMGGGSCQLSQRGDAMSRVMRIEFLQSTARGAENVVESGKREHGEAGDNRRTPVE